MPAEIDGPSVKNTDFRLAVEAQLPYGKVVKVSVTIPAEVSALVPV